MEAMYYEKKEGNKVQCKLCPHNCTINDGGLGVCRVRKNIQGTLTSINYGKITSFAFDPIEKKPLYHFYPGSSILSIGSFGCNLKCDFCQNWEIAHGKPWMTEMEDEDILKLSRYKGSIGIAYTYNEPTISYEYVYHLCKLVKENGLANVLITNGYINPEPLKELLPLIDAMNIDLKSIKEDYYKRICKGRLEPVMKTIEIASKHTHVEVTNLIVEGLNSTEEEIEELASWLAGIDKDIPLHLTKYYPAYKMDLPKTSYDVLVKAKEIAATHLNYVYIGNVAGIDNNTYCPKCSNRLISRDIRGIVVGIDNNRCTKCGKELNIIY